MPEKILITDELYMADKHRKILVQAGFELVEHRFPKCSEEELCILIRDVSGYVLGGVERVTEKVANTAENLRAIAFCGSGYTECIPAHTLLAEKQVKISNTAGSNSTAVAEFTLGLTISALKRFPNLHTECMQSKNEGTKFVVPSPNEFSKLTATVIGMGKIGSKMFEYLSGLGFKSVLTVPRVNTLRASDTSLNTALPNSDVVVVCVDKVNGENVLGKTELAKLPNGALVVNTVFPEAVDQNALYSEICQERLFTAFDGPPAFASKSLPFGRAIWSNSQAAFNTTEAIERTSDWATASILKMLKGEKDPREVY